MKAVAYCGTRNLYLNMAVAVMSLVRNTKVDKVYFLIEDDEFPLKLPDCVETMNVSGQTYFDESSPNYRRRFTYMCMVKGILSKFLPKDLDIVLSLDVDTIVMGDISGIWDLPIDNYMLAACREPMRSRDRRPYVNGGVVLYNLKKIRESKMDDIILDALRTFPYECMDQDAINQNVPRDLIYLMPSMYNVNEFTEPAEETRIRHYAANNAWWSEPEYKQYREIYINEFHDPYM